MFRMGFFRMHTWLALACTVLLFSTIYCAPPECRLDIDCKNGGLCQNNKCTTGTSPGCSSDQDCGKLERCVEKQCKFFVAPSEAVEEPQVEPQVEPQPEDAGTEALAERIPEPEPTPVGKVCISNAECGGGVCELSLNQKLVVKVCAIPTKSKVDEKCQNSPDCASGLCNAGVCVSLCVAHRHCPADYSCREIAYLEGNKVGGCVKAARTDCSGDEDCPKGLFCQANFAAGTGKASQTCGAPEGKDKEAPGTPCTLDEFPGICASHLCDKVLKTCLELCQPGLPCQNKEHTCQILPYLQSQVTACFPKPTECTKQEDCPATTTCQVSVDSADQVTYLCKRDGATQPKAIGESCVPTEKAPGLCRTGLCYPLDKAGICTATCNVDDDCKAYPKTNRCGKMAIGGTLVRACIADLAPCDYSATCPDSQPLCRPRLVDSKITKTCGIAGPGTKKVGERCSGDGLDNDCVNRFCEPGTGFCLDTCEVDEHCPTGKACRITNIGAYQIKGCVHPINAACTKQQDCLSSEYCRVEKETSATGEVILVGKCKANNGIKTYQTCVSAGPGALTSACGNGVCLDGDNICVPPCTTDADCQGRCREITLENKPQKVCHPICFHQSMCASGQDCQAGSVVNGLVRGLCVPENTAKKNEGDACVPLSNDPGTCRSGLCTTAPRKCLAFCRDNSDCKATQICATASSELSTGGLVAVKACVEKTGSCLADRQCAAGLTCQATSRDGLTFTDCLKPDTTRKGTNAACSSGAECVSGMCEGNTNTCTTPCESDTDCATTTLRPTCGTLTINSTSLKACIKP